MLRSKQKAIARKYAAAFLNVFGDALIPSDIDNMVQAASFLIDHRRAVFLLKVPVIPDAVKQEGLQDFCDRFGLSTSMLRLIDLLMNHRRVTLLVPVLKQIVKQYRHRHNEVTIIITSAVPLGPDDQERLEQFADTQFPGKKTYKYRLDRSLIAGVRLQSDTLMWEYSIDNYLRNCARAEVW